MTPKTALSICQNDIKYNTSVPNSAKCFVSLVGNCILEAVSLYPY